MSKKKEHHEEHVDETWLIPYSDMLTLLLALFIVMFAMSKVDENKLKQFSEEFNIIFSGNPAILQQGGQVATPIEKNNTQKNQVEQDKMKEIQQQLQKEINAEGYTNKVKVNLNNEGLAISIQDTVLFNSGQAAVLKDVSPLLLDISKMVRKLSNEIRIAGHTDNVPIHNSKFQSNWDLSAGRAINVMNFMVNWGGINPSRVSIQAYGEYRPVASNITAQGRAKNRRVEILIIRKYPVTTSTENK